MTETNKTAVRFENVSYRYPFGMCSRGRGEAGAGRGQGGRRPSIHPIQLSDRINGCFQENIYEIEKSLDIIKAIASAA